MSIAFAQRWSEYAASSKYWLCTAIPPHPNWWYSAFATELIWLVLDVSPNTLSCFHMFTLCFSHVPPNTLNYSPNTLTSPNTLSFIQRNCFDESECGWWPDTLTFAEYIHKSPNTLTLSDLLKPAWFLALRINALLKNIRLEQSH